MTAHPPLPGTPATRPPLLVWWLLWAATLGGLGLLWLLLARGHASGAVGAAPLTHLAGFVPLFVSIILRWLVLPRSTGGGRALVVFIVGLALAEAGGLLGLFLGGPWRDDLFLLAVLGVAQFAPFYAARLHEPKPAGFIPNR